MKWNENTENFIIMLKSQDGNFEHPLAFRSQTISQFTAKVSFGQQGPWSKHDQGKKSKFGFLNDWECITSNANVILLWAFHHPEPAWLFYEKTIGPLAWQHHCAGCPVGVPDQWPSFLLQCIWSSIPYHITRTLINYSTLLRTCEGWSRSPSSFPILGCPDKKTELLSDGSGLFPWKRKMKVAFMNMMANNIGKKEKINPGFWGRAYPPLP